MERVVPCGEDIINQVAVELQMRILVLDDEPAIGRLVARIAESLGYVVDAVTSKAAFQVGYRAHLPDVVVVDLQLGASDGIEQLRFLHEQGFRNSVILMSGFDSRVLAAAERLGEQLGLQIAAALTKPLRAGTLVGVLKTIYAKAAPLAPESLLSAIENGQLFLEYQPVVTRHPPTLRQFEALVRWQHPERGRIAPDDFIPMAERVPEVMDALTAWVLTTAARMCRRLADSGFSVSFAVNISGRNLEALDFPDRVAGILHEAGVPNEQFCLELTETAASHDPVRNIDVLSRLRLKGLSLAIDDFGIGYSSLKQLRLLPFSAIKIDRSFVSEMTRSRDALVIVKSIADLARNMELDCIAEGVETEETASAIEALGVTSMQGYLIARPMSGDAVVAWLTSWSEIHASVTGARHSMSA